jgi:hypothetical protein
LAAVVLQIVTGFRWVLGTYHVAMNELFSSYGNFVSHKPFLPMMYVCLPSSTLLHILFFSAHSSTQSLNFCWATFVSKFFWFSSLFFAIAAGSLKTRYTRASLSVSVCLCLCLSVNEASW